MFPAEQSAMRSAVVLLSSVISAIPHLTGSLTTPLGDVRSPYVCHYGHTHAYELTPHCRSPRLLRVWGHSTGRLPCCVSYQNISEGSRQGRQARRAMASHHLRRSILPAAPG